jgi:hypothetical protein
MTTPASCKSAIQLFPSRPLATSQGPKTAAEDINNTNLRFLLSIGLRPFGDPAYLASKQRGGGDFTGSGSGTVACAAGALDYNVPINATVQRVASQVFQIDADAVRWHSYYNLCPKIGSMESSNSRPECPKSGKRNFCSASLEGSLGMSRDRFLTVIGQVQTSEV